MRRVEKEWYAMGKASIVVVELMAMELVFITVNTAVNLNKQSWWYKALCNQQLESLSGRLAGWQDSHQKALTKGEEQQECIM
jgi:hypothetical protein